MGTSPEERAARLGAIDRADQDKECARQRAEYGGIGCICFDQRHAPTPADDLEWLVKQYYQR
jgi:hypothetical protein